MATQRSGKPATRAPSDLERVVLGVIWRDGPCTAYRVRQEFVESPTSHWSGSQGSIYPLLRKLESRGLVSSRRDLDDQRNTKQLNITPAGKKQLQAWFDPVQSPDSFLLEYDAIRTRMFFVQVLTPARRERYFDQLEQRLRDQQKQFAREIRGCTDDQLLHRIAWEGLLASNKAKLGWLASVRQTLSQADAG